jgi:RecB family exonuclease
MLHNIISRIAALLRPGIEVSYSRINTYLTCPWKYHLVYREGKRVPPTPFISLGLSIHRALEHFHGSKGTQLSDLIESYDTVWVNEGFQSPQQTHDFYQRGLAMLEQYFAATADSKTEILFLEKEFRFLLGRHRMRGIIDRIDRHPDGTYEVIDYKTHNELWKQEKVDADLQIGIYALACTRALGFTPQLLSYYFLAHNRKVSTTRTPEQLASALAVIEDTARKIQQGDFTPNRNHCYRCDFKKSCPHAAVNTGRQQGTTASAPEKSS